MLSVPKNEQQLGELLLQHANNRRETVLRERQEERNKAEEEISLYKDYFLSLVKDEHKYSDPHYKAFADNLGNLIFPYTKNDHFWFLLRRHILQRTKEMPHLLDIAARDYKNELLELFLGIVRGVVREMDLESESREDLLTNLGNRRKLNEDIQKAMESGNTFTMTIVYIDLDKIKNANDLFGHDRTDTIFKHIAQRMKDEAGKLKGNGITITPYRIGGDEMAFFITQDNQHDDQSESLMLIQELLDEISKKTYRVGDQEWKQHLSCGVMRIPNKTKMVPLKLLQLADGLQYLAKLTTGETRNMPEKSVLNELGQDLVVSYGGEKQMKTDGSYSYKGINTRDKSPWCAVVYTQDDDQEITYPLDRTNISSLYAVTK